MILNNSMTRAYIHAWASRSGKLEDAMIEIYVDGKRVATYSLGNLAVYKLVDAFREAFPTERYTYGTAGTPAGIWFP